MNEYIPKSIKGVPIKIVKDNENEFDVIIECPYCHAHTLYGDTISNCGYIGCPKCYWKKGGLRDRIAYLRENDYEAYLSGEFYRNDYK